MGLIKLSHIGILFCFLCSINIFLFWLWCKKWQPCTLVSGPVRVLQKCSHIFMTLFLLYYCWIDVLAQKTEPDTFSCKKYVPLFFALWTWNNFGENEKWSDIFFHCNFTIFSISFQKNYICAVLISFLRCRNE